MTLNAMPDVSLLMTVESKAFVDDVTQKVLYRSTDNGRHWQAHTIDGPVAARNIIVEADGSLLMMRTLRSAYLKYLYESVGKPYDPSSDLELLRSTDAGRTWSLIGDFIPRGQAAVADGVDSCRSSTSVSVLACLSVFASRGMWVPHMVGR